MKRIELGPAGRAVAANLKRLRVAQGLSLRGLAEDLQAGGRRLGEDALGKIERGAAEGGAINARRVDADDLVALAAALGVTPAELLVPFVPSERRHG